jgi:Family of unknown function (DUF6447)
MNTLDLDGRAFEIENLPGAATVQLTSLQFVDGEIVRLKSLLAVAQTARNAYLVALRAALPAS